MNKKAIIFIIVVVAIIAAIVFLPNGGEKQPPVERFASPQQERAMQPRGDAEHTHTPAPDVDMVHVNVQDSTGANLGHIDLVPGKVTPLEGTKFSLRLTDFYTHLVLHDNQPVNASPHPENVAARIEILEDGEVVDYTWTFEKVPFFRMGGMGGHSRNVETGLAFALESYDGLDVPETTPTNP